MTSIPALEPTLYKNQPHGKVNYLVKLIVHLHWLLRSWPRRNQENVCHCDAFSFPFDTLFHKPTIVDGKDPSFSCNKDKPWINVSLKHPKRCQLSACQKNAKKKCSFARFRFTNLSWHIHHVSKKNIMVRTKTIMVRTKTIMQKPPCFKVYQKKQRNQRVHEPYPSIDYP